jgi:hypothetical protein
MAYETTIRGRRNGREWKRMTELSAAPCDYRRSEFDATRTRATDAQACPATLSPFLRCVSWAAVEQRVC